MNKTSTQRSMLFGFFCLALISLSAQSIWPGDISDNGRVNGVDYLYWGYAYQASGPERTPASGEWTEQSMGTPWAQHFPFNHNYAYADANGDGQVNPNDAELIKNYFRRSHGTPLADTLQPLPSLNVLQVTPIPLGQGINRTNMTYALDLKINQPVEKLYGFTFALSIPDGLLRDDNGILYNITSNSFLFPQSAAIRSFIHQDLTTDTYYVTVVKTDQEGMSGEGTIGQLILQLRPDLRLQQINFPVVLTFSEEVFVNDELRKFSAEMTNLSITPNDFTVGGCPSTVDPVCGSDGHTYLNSCYAEAAGVTDYTAGPCFDNSCIDYTEIDSDANCTTEYNPVCGCNGVTYPNPCQADAAGVINTTPGPCPTSDNCYDPQYVVTSSSTTVDATTGVITVNCPTTYDPVCGCNGVTYTNACLAEASGIRVYTPGTCESACIDPLNIDPDAQCTTEYDPVCGCNGVTYTNPCRAEAAGLESYTYGSCNGTSAWCDEAIPVQCGDFLANETTVGAGNNIVQYPGCSSNTFYGPDRVYVIEKTTIGDLQIGLEITTPGMDLDLFLLGDDCSQLTCLAKSTTNNSQTNNEGIVYEDAPLGTYYIVVDGQHANSEGSFRLEVSCGYLYCGNAVPLSCGQTYSGTNLNGNDDVSLYTCGTTLNVENNGPEIVHTFTTTQSGPVAISLTGLSANLELFLLDECDRGACIKYSQNAGTTNEYITDYLPAGTYYVVVDGYNGAVSDYDLHIDCTNACDLSVVNLSATGSGCGQSSGSITISTSGGTPNYLISYSGPRSGSFTTSANTCTIYYLPPGVYTVTKTDASGCTVSGQVTVLGGGNLSVNLTPYDAVCMSGGRLGVYVSNGQAPYTVRLQGPTSGTSTVNSNDFTINDLDPGNYTVYITDYYGCTVSQQITIGQSSGDFLWNYTVTPAACGGYGAIHVNTYNGVPPYNIAVQGPVSGGAVSHSSSFNIINLPGGTYQLTIEDGNWCQQTRTVVVPNESVNISLTESNGVCGQEGSIGVYISNGTPGYHISWTGPESGTANTVNGQYNISSLTAGTYTIAVTDYYGCTDTETVTLSTVEGGGLDANVIPLDGACGQNGALWVDIYNGVAPYTINWTGPESGVTTTYETNFDVANLPCGTYQVIITDANGCDYYQSTIIGGCDNIEVNLTPVNGICGQEGSIQVSITGGSPVYTVSWSGPESGQTTTATNNVNIPTLTAGTYTVSVTGSGGCTDYAVTQLSTSESSLVLQTSVSEAVCGAEGSIGLTILGGVGPYQISWTGPESGVFNTPNNSNTISNLSPGTYQLYVVDGNSCSESTAVTIQNTGSDLNVSLVGNNGICNNFGNIGVNVFNGQAPYTINYTGPITGTYSTNNNVSQIQNTPAGTYTVVVTDANGCSTSGTVQISVQNNLVANLTPVNGQCDSPGSIQVFISQGQPGFNISWTNGSDVNGATTIAGNMYTITDLPSGNYSVVITDQAGCTRTLSTTIDNGNGNLEIVTSLIYNICGQYNTIWVDVIGGTPPYTVTWTGTQGGSATTTTQGYEIMDLPPGTYKVTIVDANGCMTMQPGIVVYPAPVNIMAVTPFNGVCGEDGYLQVDITGGTAPYTLSWNGPSSGTQNYQGGTNIITNLPSGTYTLTLVDANGCTETETVSLTNGGEPLEVTTALIYNDCGQYNTIWVDVVGGTPPYTVTWVELENGIETGTETHPTGAFEIYDLPPGTYKVTVVDVNGCMDMDTGIVIYPSPINIFTASGQDGVCGQTGKINIDVIGGTGPYTLTYTGPISGTQQVPAGASVLTGFPSGTYTLTLTDANGCTETETVIISNTQGNPVTIQTSLIYNLCGQYNTIWVDIFGGTPPYTVSWTGGENGSVTVTQPEHEIMDLPPGTYKVTVIDVNGCMDMQQDIIIYPAPVAIFNATTTNGECGGPGTITVNITAGTAPYTLQYAGPISGTTSIAGTSFILDPAPAGIYTLTLTDANGCTEVEQATVSTTENGLELTAMGENGDCITDPSITAQAAGGAGTYTLTWTGPESGSATIGNTPYTIDGLSPGTYTLTAEDGSSCSDTEQVTIAQPEDDLLISLTPSPGNCGSAGQIGVSIAGGSPDYTISWSGPSAGNVTISGSFVSIPNLSSGIYTVTVTDNGGCTDVSTTNLQNGSSNVSVTATAQTGQCGAYGSISLVLGGGNGTYQLSWTGPTSGTRTVTGSTTQLTNLLPGSYQITATSAGCSSGASVFLGTGTPPLQISSSTSHAGCVDDGSIAVSLSGTQGNTTLSWSGPESGSTVVTGSSYVITGLPAGTYTLSATSGICSDTETATVGDSGASLTVTASPVGGVCGNDGSIILYISGGSAPYQIQWTGAENGSMTSNSTTVTIPNLRAGSYSIQVNSGACTATAAANVTTSGNNLLITATPQAGTCLAPPAIWVELAGGTAPYQLSWAGPSSGNTTVNGSSYRIEDLTAGFYSLTVIDANGCTRSTTASLTDQDLAISLSGQNGTCGDNTVITVSISNGVGPYTISWYGEIDGYAVSNQSTYSMYNLPGGTYQVTVEDINGCMASGTVTVESGATDFYVQHMVSDNGCGMLNNIWMDFYNGQAPYHIEWIGPESGFVNVDVDGYDITELPSGYYIIIVTDATGCIDVQQVEVVNMPNDLDVTFSPQNGSCGSNGSIGVHATGGTPTYTVSWYLNGQPVSVRFINGNYFHIGDLAAGNYLVIVEDDGGCEQRGDFLITTGATQMELDLTPVAPGCNNDGSIGVTFGGGQAPFQVQWSGAASGSASTDDYSYLIDGLDGGSYDVSVTDANGCSGSASAIVYGTIRGDVNAAFHYQEDELRVDFFNESTNGLYFWDFGDGTQITTYEENISHTFPTAGTYQVCLRMTEPCGTDIHCESITVESMGTQALLDIGENSGGSGSTISLPVTLENADNIISLAGSVNVVDDAVGQLVSVTPGVIAPQFNAANQTFSYFSNGGSPIYFSSDEVLFYFNIQLTGNSGQRTTVEWAQWPLPIEIGTMVNGEASTLPYTTSDGEAMITDVAGLRGIVTTFWNEPLADTEISIVGPGYSASMMTEEDGTYDMPDLTAGMEYTVSASREGDHTNGLSTYALFIGQRFLLGMEPEQIYSPYQVVAGDANCNDAFTTLDLFLIQRLIIGAATEFTTCPSWTFVSDVSEMPDDFDAYNVFPYVNSHPMMLMQPQSADYVGVKVGDILGEAYLQGMAPNGGYQVDRRGSGLLTFRSANPTVSAGEEVTLYFTSEEFADIVSYQFGLQFPADQLEFLEFLPATTAPFQTVVAGDSQASEGKLRLSWFSLDGEGHSAASDTPLFGIRFRALRDITDFGAIMRIDPEGMRPEAFDATEQNLLPTLDFNSDITSTDDPLAAHYALYQNVPNPVSNETLISFYLPEANTATISLRDAFGKTVWTQTQDYLAGQQQVKVDGSRLAAGVYHYTLQAGSFRATKSLVVVR